MVLSAGNVPWSFLSLPFRVVEQEGQEAGQEFQVAVPTSARLGRKVAVPILTKGESAESVHRKQQGMITSATVAAGTATVKVVASIAEVSLLEEEESLQALANATHMALAIGKQTRDRVLGTLANRNFFNFS